MTRSGQHDKRDDARQVGSKRHERKGADDSKAIGRGTTTGRQWDDRRGGGIMLGDPAVMERRTTREGGEELSLSCVNVSQACSLNLND